MRIAVVLSGTVRQPEQSLESIEILKGEEKENTVVVYAHAWHNVADTQNQSWSKVPSLEPTEEIIQRYNPCRYESHDWMSLKPSFVELHAKWVREYGLTNITTYGALGMFWSLGHAFSLIHFGEFGDFDVIVRMRYDCLLRHNPLHLIKDFGLHIPQHADFGGLNDQLAFFKCARDDDEPGGSHKSWWLARGYFRVWDALDRIMSKGRDYHPELWMKLSVEEGGVSLFRPRILYTIH